MLCTCIKYTNFGSLLDDQTKYKLEKIMETTGKTVLITGGGSGIGLYLAEEFLKADSKVIICGRSMARL